MVLRLEDYGISPKTGFLPSDPLPLTRLPGAYFEPWERLVDNLSHLLVAWKLRNAICNLPELDASNLKSEAEYQRAFLVLSLISHSYVWGAKGEPVLQVLPRNIAVPWILVSQYIGLRPTSCHAALVYYNFKLLDVNSTFDLSNLATLHTVSGGIDESWFYLITVAIEAEGAVALPAIIDSLQAVKTENFELLEVSLNTIANAIDRMTATLLRMPENCDPYIFYNRVRIYFSGWSNMKDLPNGLLYEGDKNEIESMFAAEKGEVLAALNTQAGPKFYPGGSAAQSSLIHTLDVFLNVKHYATGYSKDSEEPMTRHVNFLLDMRHHIPAKHRKWLFDLMQHNTVPGFIEQRIHEGSPSITGVATAFNKCVMAMKNFRDQHIRIVTRYIIIQARRASQTGQETASSIGYHGMGPQSKNVINEHDEGTSYPVLINNGLESAPMLSGDTSNRGTGGTDIIPFLKQSRDETASALLTNLKICR